MLHLFLQRAGLVQFIKYGILGVLINASVYLIYLLATHLGVPPKTAMTVLYMTAVVAGFFGNRSLVFQSDGKITGAALRFFLAHLIGYTMNFMLLWFFSDIMHYPHEYVQAVAILIVAFFLFFFMRLFVFKQTR